MSHLATLPFEGTENDMLCRDRRTRLLESDLEQGRVSVREMSAAIAVIWLALYGYMAGSAAIGSFGDIIVIAHAME